MSMENFYKTYYDEMLKYLEAKFPDTDLFARSEAAAYITSRTMIVAADSAELTYRNIRDGMKASTRKRYSFEKKNEQNDDDRSE